MLNPALSEGSRPQGLPGRRRSAAVARQFSAILSRRPPRLAAGVRGRGGPGARSQRGPLSGAALSGEPAPLRAAWRTGRAIKGECPMSEVSRLLSNAGSGDSDAAAQLFQLVYDDLRRLAAHRLAHESPGQTLEPTALVHEAYLRLLGDKAGASWDGRGHFFAAAAEAMRRILVENARRKKRLKHGGERARLPLEEAELLAPQPREDVLALDEALTQLAATDRAAADLVRLRYFGGLSIPDAAQILGVSPRTATRLWTFARTWLWEKLQGAGDDLPS